jgi:putative PEP-CTERM system integral membrane protein
MQTVKRFFSVDIWGHALFWTWNLVFLAFMLLGFAPNLLPEMINAVRADQIPAEFLAYGIILVSIPVLAVALGALRLRREPAKLLALGYGVEGPLMVMLLIRFFVIGQATPAVILIMTVAALGIATLLWQLLDRRIDQRGPALSTLRVIGLSLLLATGLHAAAWLSFYAVAVAGAGGNMLITIAGNLPEFFNGVFTALVELFTTNLLMLPFVVLGFTLVIFTATLFVLMPIAVVVIYSRSWWRGVQNFRWSRPLAVGLSMLVLAGVVGLYMLANRQPQHAAFALLENPPASRAEAQALLAEQDTIRRGLLNAFLAPQRYLSATGDVVHIEQMYQDTFGLSPDAAGQVQDAYETVVQPLLYQPVNPPAPSDNPWENAALRQEPTEAADLYASFFDEPIVDGERDAVVAAARSTWSVDQAEAAWQAVDDREVHLQEQTVSVTEQGDWAEVELYEVYQNQTGQRQEVVYYFSLPESAVITGVWLGNSANRDERFEYRVSPRGAAQTLYRQEVRRNIDPALVEQIGPRQYRLRVFPIEPRRMVWDEDSPRSRVEVGPPLHMWLTYRVLAQNNAWPLPQLADLRNVYWDRHSVRQVNGQTISLDDWLPEAVPAAGDTSPQMHQTDFASGDMVVARPATGADVPPLPADLRLAVVLDRSRSMARHAAAVKSALAELDSAAAAIDLYLTASEFRGEGPSVAPLAQLTDNALFYFGGQNAAELLAQFEVLRGQQQYDAVLVLTDGTGYKLVNDESATASTPNVPLWMVHLGGDFPLGYDDATLESIQASGGGAAGSVSEALIRLAVSLSPLAGTADVVDGYVWEALPGGQAQAAVEFVSNRSTAADEFAPFAARRLILAEMQRHRGKLDQVETLDQLHAIAVENSVVTPYSSMIVLVNDAQARRLAQLEQQADRFAREHEDVGETVPAPLNITGVPEPEEWLLLALVVLMLGWLLRDRRRKRAALAA